MPETVPVSELDAPSAVPVREVGYAIGSNTAAGLPDDGEFAEELRWPHSVAVYDRMRRSDATISSMLRAVTLSLRRLTYTVDPAGADPVVVRSVASNLGLPVLGDDRLDPPPRTRGRFSFLEHVRLATLMVVWGHMPFEQVVDVVVDDELGRPMAKLRKLAPRMPTTLAAINVERDGGLKSIEQKPMPGAAGIDYGGQYGNVAIRVNRLVFYSFEREGAAWQGVSVLRPPYKHWLLKDRLLRTDTAAAERNGMGVPWYTAPEGATQGQIDDYAAVAAAVRAGDEAGGAGPYGSKFELVGVSGQLPDLLRRIQYHDAEISRTLYTQFLRLGESSSGNRALGESFIDFFLSAVDAIATELLATFNPHVVEDLVDWNFGEAEPAPRVVAAPAKERKSLSAAELVALAQAGLLTQDPELEAYVRERYGLPMPTGGELGQGRPQGSTPPPRNLPDAEPNDDAEEAEASEGMADTAAED